MTTVWIILTTIACYFALLFIISWITGRKADNAGFFTGNRKSSWYMVTLAMIGATISGVTFISVPGAVLRGDIPTCRWFWASSSAPSSWLSY